MTLDLASLRKAVISLEEALAATLQCTDGSQGVQKTLRAGVIQNFEFTFELCWKFIQRWLQANESSAETDAPRTRKDLFRSAARIGLIEDPLKWFEYAEARNLTSHTYSDDKAEQVYSVCGAFALDATALLKNLERLNG